MEGDEWVSFHPFCLGGIIFCSYCLQTMPEQHVFTDIGQNHARELPLTRGQIEQVQGSNLLPGSIFFGRTDIACVWMLQSHNLKQQPGVSRENAHPLYKRVGVLPVRLVRAEV